MSNVCLVTLCGLPAAGKTTFAQSFTSYLLHQRQNKVERKSSTSNGGSEYQVVHVVYDSMLPVVPKTCSATSDWKSYRQAINNCIDKLLDRLLSEKCAGSVDSTSEDTEDANSVLQKCAKSVDSTSEDTEDANSVLQKCAKSVDSTSKDTENISSVHVVVQEFNRLTKELDVNDATCHPVVLVLDDNMFYASMRYEIYQLARKYSTGYAQLHFTATLACVMERNHRRSCSVPDDVIESMASRIDVPTSQNAWEINTIEWTDEDLNSHNYQKVVALIDKALRNPVLPLVEDSSIHESRVICSTNVIHQSDCVLRHLVAEHITKMKAESTDSELLRLQAKQANQARQRLLQDMRQHVLLIPQSIEDAVQRSVLSGQSSTTGCDCLLDFIRTAFTQYLLNAQLT